MKLARLGDRGSERPVALVGEDVFDLSSIASDIDGTFLEHGGLNTVRSYGVNLNINF